MEVDDPDRWFVRCFDGVVTRDRDDEETRTDRGSGNAVRNNLLSIVSALTGRFHDGLAKIRAAQAAMAVKSRIVSANNSYLRLLSYTALSDPSRHIPDIAMECGLYDAFVPVIENGETSQLVSETADDQRATQMLEAIDDVEVIDLCASGGWTEDCVITVMVRNGKHRTRSFHLVPLITGARQSTTYASASTGIVAPGAEVLLTCRVKVPIDVQSDAQVVVAVDFVGKGPAADIYV
ncbi:hypothetical protein HK104_008687 [Borealophlyctis nickersoniae]|nr:hypothetical protein HK104_008687 [Borealophlyctis nickersoniae]